MIFFIIAFKTHYLFVNNFKDLENYISKQLFAQKEEIINRSIQSPYAI